MHHKTISITFALLSGMAAVVAVIFVLAGPAAPVQADLAAQPWPAPVLQTGSPITRYVAISGADTYTCATPGGACRTVQYAVDVAHAGDVIKVAGGAYMGVQARPAPPGYVGSSVITQVVYVTKTVTIQGGYTTTNWLTPHPITQPTTLDAQSQGRVLFIAGDISPTIEGLRITGGDASGLGGMDYDDVGGGVCVITATATISNNWVFSNTASQGGGICLYDSAATVSGNSITSNTAGTGGGLDLLYSAALVSHNTIVSNTASGVGGGLSLSFSEATVSRNIIVSNTADFGGGVYIQVSDGVLDGNTISSNTAEGFVGGGVAVLYSETTFSNNAVISNTAFGAGGGLWVEGSDVTIVNTIIADNAVIDEDHNDGFGSGLYVWGGGSEDYSSLVRLLHTTIARNTGGDGSGIYVEDGLTHSNVFLTNTILVSHTVGITVTEDNTVTLEATLWGTGDWANGTDWAGEGTIITGTPSHNYWGDPGFLNPDGGDYHIGPGSAAIDAGVDAGVMTDIDGQIRDASPDLGADERSGPCFARLNDGDVYPTVQAAVDGSTHHTDVVKVAGDCSGVGVRPAPPGYVGSSVITQVVYVTKAVTIQGGYTTTNWLTPHPVTQPTTLDAQGQGRVFFIAGDVSPTVEGLHITGGDATGLGGFGSYAPLSLYDTGGGIYILTSTATISNNWVFSNTAGSSDSETIGGGLCLHGSDATLGRNTVMSNTAWRGSGLYLYHSPALLNDNTVVSNIGGDGLFLFDDSDATLVGNTISCNTGTGLSIDGSDATAISNTISNNVGPQGGGLGLWGSAAVIVGNTIVSNTANYEGVWGEGGGVYIAESDGVIFSGNVVTGNASAGQGGGLYLVLSSDVALTNNIVADNRASVAGSGLYVRGSSPRLMHTTVARNSGGDGSGVYVTEYDDTYSNVILTNTILVSHTVGITVTAGNTATLEATLWGTGAWANGTDWAGEGTIITGTSSYNHWADPVFVNPDGGDYHIRSGSAAIDAGVDAGVMTDIDGQARDAAPDLGADEWVYLVYLPLVLRNLQ